MYKYFIIFKSNYLRYVIKLLIDYFNCISKKRQFYGLPFPLCSKLMVGRVIPSITKLELSNRWIY